MMLKQTQQVQLGKNKLIKTKTNKLISRLLLTSLIVFFSQLSIY